MLSKRKTNPWRLNSRWRDFSPIEPSTIHSPMHAHTSTHDKRQPEEHLRLCCQGDVMLTQGQYKSIRQHFRHTQPEFPQLIISIMRLRYTSIENDWHNTIRSFHNSALPSRCLFTTSDFIQLGTKSRMTKDFSCLTSLPAFSENIHYMSNLITVHAVCTLITFFFKPTVGTFTLELLHLQWSLNFKS